MFDLPKILSLPINSVCITCLDSLETLGKNFSSPREKNSKKSVKTQKYQT